MYESYWKSFKTIESKSKEIIGISLEIKWKLKEFIENVWKNQMKIKGNHKTCMNMKMIENQMKITGDHKKCIRII